MRRQRNTTPVKLNPNWEFADEYQLSPRVTLTVGSKFKVKGESGQTFVFVHFVRNKQTKTEWVDCVCVETKEHRAFRPERITRRVK